MDDIWSGLNVFSSKIVDKRNELKKYIDENKGYVFETLTKMKKDFT